MAFRNDTFTQHQLKRWTRPDAHHFVRADWRRQVRPGFEGDHPFALYERKYDPNQARVPSGSPAGGQWTSDNQSNSPRIADVGSSANAPINGAKSKVKIAASISPQRLEECEIMRREDEFICKAVQKESCYTQAYLRYSNCLAGRPIPRLFF